VVCGQTLSEQAVYAEVCKDRDYYAATGGGVTFSGGECLLQPDFVRAAVDLCHVDGIHTAVESALCVPWSSVERVMDGVDLFLADIKHPDDGMHKQLTGQGNRQILDNIGRLSRSHQAINIRVPLIPTANDDQDSLLGIANIVNSFGPGIQSVELLRYNNLAEGKYRSLGRPFHRFAGHPQDDAALEACAAILRSRLRDNVPVLYQ
jgi:pyruvate formate lyase activating enzyme